MKTKTLLLTLAVLMVSAGLMGKTKVPGADAVMKKAYKQADRQDKKVFLMFHASWCGWCHRMDSLMNDADVNKFFDDHFVITHLVVQESPKNKHLENEGAQELMVKHNGDKQGIPFWLIFNPKGELLADSRMETINKEGKTVLANTGCPAQPEEVDYFIKVLKQNTKLTDEELAVVRDKFLLKR